MTDADFEDKLAELVSEAREAGVGAEAILTALETASYSIHEEVGDEPEDE